MYCTPLLKTAYYFRSPILSFYDLDPDQQKEYPEDDFCDCLFVFDDLRNDLLLLDNFLRPDRPGRFHGIYAQSYFSAYFIYLSACNTAATVVYKYYSC